MTIESEGDYHDLCTVLTWYEHIPAKWKEPAVCRDSKVFARIRRMCLEYERQVFPAVEAIRADLV